MQQKYICKAKHREFSKENLPQYDFYKSSSKMAGIFVTSLVSGGKLWYNDHS